MKAMGPFLHLDCLFFSGPGDRDSECQIWPGTHVGQYIVGQITSNLRDFIRKKGTKELKSTK